MSVVLSDNKDEYSQRVDLRDELMHRKTPLDKFNKTVYFATYPSFPQGLRLTNIRWSFHVRDNLLSL